MSGFGLAPAPQPQGLSLLASVATGVTSGAVTAMLIYPKRRPQAFKVLLAALAIDAVLMGFFERRYGGV